MVKKIQYVDLNKWRAQLPELKNDTMQKVLFHILLLIILRVKS